MAVEGATKALELAKDMLSIVLLWMRRSRWRKLVTTQLLHVFMTQLLQFFVC